MEQIDHDTLLRAARAMAGAGVGFVWGGSFGLSPELAAMAPSDPLAVTGACLGMTREEVEEHDRHDWRCRAMTRRGVRCSLEVAACGHEKGGSMPVLIEPGNPRFFYCPRHIGAKGGRQ